MKKKNIIPFDLNDTFDHFYPKENLNYELSPEDKKLFVKFAKMLSDPEMLEYYDHVDIINLDFLKNFRKALSNQKKMWMNTPPVKAMTSKAEFKQLDKEIELLDYLIEHKLKNIQERKQFRM